MIVIVCLDDQDGMCFNHRRQSQDRLLRQDLLRETAGRPLWMSPYSAGQFREPVPDLRQAPDCLDRAGAGEFCFVEEVDPAPWASRMEGLILYRWGRTYPADLRSTLPLAEWRLVRSETFAGSSHEKICKEVYAR